MTKQDQNLQLLEKLFDAKLDPLYEKIDKVYVAIYGNGRPGLLERVEDVEYTQKNIMGKFAGFTIFFGFIFTGLFELIKEFLRGKLKI